MSDAVLSKKKELLEALAPVLEAVKALDLEAKGAAERLAQAFPLEGPVLTKVRAILREGIEAGVLCDRENEGVRFSRLKKADDDGISIDLVHMRAPGPGHLHPNGEVDLCFAVSGEPLFDGNPPGFTVYPRGSWHVPSVSGGVMDILYFLPGGAIEFGPKPS